MACFIVPLTQAIATTVYRKTLERKPTANHSPFNAHLASLETMLYGGSLMLIVDHILNGEVTWMYPFFTALATEGGGAVMLREILTVGVPMSVIVTLAWGAWCYLKERKAVKA